MDFHRKVAAGDGFGDRSHFLQVLDHRVERPSQVPDLIFSVNVDVVLQIAALADLLGHVNQPGQRPRDSGGRPVGDDDAQAEREQGTDHRSQNRPGRGVFVVVPPLVQQFAILLVDIVENDARTRDPGVGILLQIENLQLAYRRVAAIHRPAFLHQRVGELVAPSLLHPLHFFQVASLLRGIRQVLRMAQGVRQLVFAVIHLFHVTGVPAEQVVLQVQPVLHHPEADQRGHFGHVDRALRRGFGLVFAMHSVQIDDQQH